MTKAKSVWLAAFGLLLLAVTVPAQAADAPSSGLNLTVSPSPIQLIAKPGSTTTTTIRIHNNNPQAEKLRVTLLKFGPSSDDSGEAQIAAFGPADQYKNWVSFSQNQITAQPDTWQDLQMTIALPKTAAFDYYYAVVLSRASLPLAQTGKSVVSGSVATLVLLTANTPGMKRSMELDSVSATKRVYEYLPATFDVTVRNTGQAYGAPVGNIFITKGKKQVGALAINGNGGNILAHSGRTFSAQWNDGYPVVVTKQKNGVAVTNQYGDTKTQVHWGPLNLSKFRMGRYTAKVAMAYSDGHTEVPLEGDVTFWVIPWKILLVALLIVAIFGIGLYTTFRGLGRRVSKRRLH